MATFVVWFGLNATGEPPEFGDANRQDAVQFLEQVRSGQADAAWTATSAEFKSYMGRENFRRYVATQPVLKQPLELGEVKMIDVEGLPVAACSFRAPNRPENVQVWLAEEQRAWKVVQLKIER